MIMNKLDRMFMPSMMCVPPYDLREVVEAFKMGGIEGLHIDVMDGHFVPNMQLGTDYCKHLRRLSDIPLDFHMMVEEPEYKLDWFPIEEGDFVSIHVESTRHLQRAFDRIKTKGALPIVALNPGTPLSMVEEVLPDAYGVLLMTVNPGYAGQKLVGHTIDKIRRLREMLDARGYENIRIEVDGNVNEKHLVMMNEAGADMYVIGSSGFLNTSDPEEIKKGIEHFRALVK